MELMHPKIHYYAALGCIRGLTPARFYRLMQKYGDSEYVWNASVHEITQVGIEQEIAEQFVAERKNIDPLYYFETIQKKGISVVCCDDDAYPALLKEISHPPFVLFYRGCLPSSHSDIIGVVGTRNASWYGIQVTPGIVSDLVQNGFCIASGLARGIDTIAHRTCLEHNGVALAVLGTGVDDTCIYPPQNRTLAHQIIERGGCVISEYVPGTQVQAYHFPARNRIISGLSRGIVVVEAAERSGALITARHALDQNRDVFAVPGPIYNPMSAGPHSLIKQGAIPLTSSADICDHYALDYSSGSTKKNAVGENTQECELLRILSEQPQTIDELCRLCDLDTKTITSTLMVMEMKRMVRNIGAMRYVIN